MKHYLSMRTWIIVALASLYLASASFATAQVKNTPSPTTEPGAVQSGTGGLTNPLSAGSLTELLYKVLAGVVQIGSIFLVLMLVYVGFLFVSAQGAEEKLRTARQALLWTVIGGLLLLGAQTIALVIESTIKTLQ